MVGSPPGAAAPKSLRECLTALLQIGQIFGYTGAWDSRTTEEHWTACSKEIGWITFARYKLAAYFAYHHNLELPPSPVPAEAGDKPGLLVGGRLGRFFRICLQAMNKEQRDEFLFSIKMTKKGMPRGSKAQAEEAARKTVKLLTTKPPLKDYRAMPHLLKWSESDDIDLSVQTVLNKDTIKQQLDRTVKELFGEEGDSKLTTKERVKAFFPSTSANYIRSRAGAGAVGEIIAEERTLLKGLRRKGGYLKFETIRSGEGKEEERIEDEGRHTVRITSESEAQFDKAFQDLWLRMLLVAARDEDNLVEAVGLVEALKFRVITKSSPYRMTVLRAIWKKLHSTLRKHPAFELIGREKPVDSYYLLQRLGANLADDEAYLSGDYASATDNLLSWISEQIADSLSKPLSLYPVESRLLVDALTRHNFMVEGVKLPQERGQLMGSIVSFPILCIAVATAVRWACEISRGRKTSLRDAPMAVNGDDNAARLRERGYHAWLAISQAMGLESSLGKTYFTREFVEINSRQFTRCPNDPDEILVIKTITKEPEPLSIGRHSKIDRQIEVAKRKIPFREVKFVNLGLLSGMKRSSGKAGLDTLSSSSEGLGARYRDLLKSCPHFLTQRVHKAFLSRHWLVLKKSTLPWFIPEWLGGVGLLGIQEPSELDRRIAAAILWNWTKIHPVPTGTMDAPWKTWELASRSMPKPVRSETKSAGTESYSSQVARKCVDLIFDTEITLDHLFKVAVDEKGGKERLRHNERLWTVSKYKKLPPPMTMEALMFRPSYNSYDERVDPPPERRLEIDLHLPASPRTQVESADRAMRAAILQILNPD